MVRGKDAKALIRRIQDGGHVDDRGQGKLRVTVPDGTTMVGDRAQGAALTRMISKIRRETGLEL